MAHEKRNLSCSEHRTVPGAGVTEKKCKGVQTDAGPVRRKDKNKNEQDINAPKYKCALRSEQKVYKLRDLRKTEKKYQCCGSDKHRH